MFAKTSSGKDEVPSGIKAIPLEKRKRIVEKLEKLGVGQGGKILTGSYVLEAVDPEHRSVLEQNRLRSKHWDQFMLDKDFEGDFFDWLAKNKVPVHQDRKVAYLEDAQRKNYKITFKDTKIVPNEAAEKMYKDFLNSYSGELIFVLALDSLYVGVKSTGKFHHSSLFAGRAVQAAGTMFVESTEVLKVTNYSGHYKPGWSEMVKVVEHMKKNGANVSNIVYEVSTGKDSTWKGNGPALISAAGKIEAQ